MLLTALFIPSAVAQYAPVFQFAIFYNLDLEICPGAAMTINGHVHSNKSIWTTGSSSSQLLTYAGLVDASQTIYYTRSPNDPQSYTTGNVRINITTNNPLTNVPMLTIPVSTNNNPSGNILNLPPPNLIAPNDAAYSPTGTVYLYNGCDLIISNAASGTNISVFYNNQFATPRLTTIFPDVLVFSTNNITHIVTTNSYYTFVTNTSFYDYRESDTVKAVEIDVGKLRIWLTNAATRGGKQFNTLNSSGATSKGHGINSVYVFNNIPFTSNQLPAVRLVNGTRLPSAGLTVATAQPIYVKGDYNTTTDGTTFSTTLGSSISNTVPAAIMGDAVTILSSAWIDTWNSATSFGSRSANRATINAAVLEGIVQSVTDAGGTKHYSGGVENFLRLLEDWSGNTLVYNGSMVVLFPSQYATNYWIGPGTYYNPPTRNWGFDVNFNQPQHLPPLTPLLMNTNPPFVIVQPQSQTNLPGSTTAFSVTASNALGVWFVPDSPNLPNYQWTLSGTNIFGATNATLILTNLQSSQAGIYAVQMTNRYGSVTSSNAVLTIYEPAILNSVSFSEDKQIQFDLTGVSGLHYAVQTSTNLVDWVPLITNTSPFSFTDTNLSGFQQRFYRTIYVP